MGASGRLSAVGNKLTWVPGGMLTEPAVTVHSKNGVTRVHYIESLANRGQRIVGFTTLGALCGLINGGLAASISAKFAGAAAGMAIGVVVGLVAVLGVVLLLRGAFAKRARTRNSFAERVVAQVVAAVRASAVTSATKTRVATADGW